MLKALLAVFMALVSWQFCQGQSVLDQPVDFFAYEVSIPTALKRLSKKSGVDIAFSKGFFTPGKLVSVGLGAGPGKNPETGLKIGSDHSLGTGPGSEPLKTYLYKILDGTGTGFKLVGNRIIVFRNRATLSGYVVEEETGEALVAATVYCPRLKQGTFTNEYGYFSIDLPAGEWQLEYRYLGFQKVTMKVNIKEDEVRRIAMSPGLYINPVLITPEKEDGVLPTTATARSVDIDPEMVASAPSLGGEEDYLRTAQLLPGVQQGVDGAAGLHIRGGDPGHNLMLLDGVPVYIPFHLLGIYSIYNSSIVKSAKLVKGRYSARYGGRLASVFDLRTREGSREGLRASASANLINSRVNFGFPFGNKRGSVLASGRNAPNAALLRPFFDKVYFPNQGGTFETKFNDIFGKVNIDLSVKDRLYFSFFRTLDEFGKEYTEQEGDQSRESESEIYWNNTVSALRWNHLVNNKLFANTTLTYSRYSYKFKSYDEFLTNDTTVQDELYYINNSSKNQDLGLRSDMDWFLSPKHTLRFGSGVSLRKFNPALTYFDQNSTELEDLEAVNGASLDNLVEPQDWLATEGHFYLEDRWDPRPGIGVDLGFRGSFFVNESRVFFRPEPRLTIDLQATPRLAFFTSGSRMIQYMHLISNTTIRFPNDLWIPSSDGLMPQESWLGEVGLRWQISNHLLFTLEAYGRKMKNLYTVPAGYDFLDSFDLTTPAAFLSKGEGKAYGAESQLSYEGTNNQGIISYTFARTTRQFSGENLNLAYPQDFDRSHQFKLFFYQKIKRLLGIGLSFQYLSGSPRLDLVNVERGLGLTNTVLHPPGEKNRIRSEPYHRLDLNLRYTLVKSRWVHCFKVGVFNLYNRKNVSYYRTSPRGGGGAEPVFSIPLTPSASYTLSFNQ